MGDDLELGQLVHHAREHNARHGGGGLIGPAEGPPDLVFRLVLVPVVGHLLPAAGMDQDRLAAPGAGFEDAEELGLVERATGDVGIDLHAIGTIVEGALQFAGGIGMRHADGRRIARETVGIFLGQFGQPVIGELRHLMAERGVVIIQRRLRDRQDLRIILVLEHVHDAETFIEIVDAGDGAHALADRLFGARDRQHLVEEGAREEMVEGIDILHVNDLPDAHMRPVPSGGPLRCRGETRRAGPPSQPSVRLLRFAHTILI